MRLLLCFLFAAGGLFSDLAISEIYKWIDNEGNVHYGSAAPDAVQSKEIDVSVSQKGEGYQGKLRTLLIPLGSGVKQTMKMGTICSEIGRRSLIRERGIPMDKRYSHDAMSTMKKQCAESKARGLKNSAVFDLTGSAKKNAINSFSPTDIDMFKITIFQYEELGKAKDQWRNIKKSYKNKDKLSEVIVNSGAYNSLNAYLIQGNIIVQIDLMLNHSGGLTEVEAFANRYYKWLSAKLNRS